MKIRFTLLSVAAMLLLSAFVYRKSDKHTYYSSSFENVLGTSFDMHVKAENENAADRAEAAALAEIDRLSAILSSYDRNSEFSRWQRTQEKPVPVSQELLEVFTLFENWQSATQGAIDPSVGTVIDVWKHAEKNQILPTAEKIETALNQMNRKHWQIDNVNGTITHYSDAPLLFNTFTKSYILDKVASKVTALQGISGVAVNIGGDITVRGDVEESIRIAEPALKSDNSFSSYSLQISNKTIATSGNYKRGYAIAGKWYSHIIDARNGKPADHVLSATVIADKGTDAGALATAFNILSPQETAILAAEKQVAYQLILEDGTELQNAAWTSLLKGDVSNLEHAKPPIALKGKEWDKSYEVNISFELARFEGRFRRPFVAIWVEDSKKNTVKTLALWYNKPRWLPDLKEWYRKNDGKYTPETKDIATISSATRPPGSYVVKWDGKDEQGKYVVADTYTIYIEAAREHGTYQLIKQEVVCKDKVQEWVLKGNEEVSAASIAYKKK
jgi:thiamine biosynthesis lipoprotein ApbE